MYDSVIFDVDGTIWNTTFVVAKAWNRALDETGLSYAHVDAARLQGLFGLPMDDIIADILPNEPMRKREEFKLLCYKYEHSYLNAESGIPYPHMTETFRALAKKVPIFIVSNCQSGYIELMLEKTGLGEYVKDIACYGDKGLLKAANIKMIVHKHSLNSPLYVGDTQMDANACAEACVPIAYARYGFGTVASPAHIIDDVADLLNII